MPAFVIVGMGLIFLGVLVIAVGSLLTMPEEKGVGQPRVAVGGVFGFIPFGFGNDSKMVYVAMGIAAFLLALFLIWHLMR